MRPPASQSSAFWLASLGVAIALLHGCECGPPRIPFPEEDSGVNDAGRQGEDAGPPDAGSTDGGSSDAGSPDAGPPDAGVPDAGPLDAGAHDAGLVLVLHAADRAMLDEEFVDLVTDDRLHLRDDGRACGGFGAVRSIARWDVSEVPCLQPASVNVRWVYGHDFGEYSGGPRQIAMRELHGSWTGSTATWNNAPMADSTPWATTELVNIPDASILFPVTLDAGVDGLMLQFVSETCPAPRWPAELTIDPTLEVVCP